MEDGALFIVVYTFGNSNFLHQTVHPIYANFRTRYLTCRRTGTRSLAHGAWRRRHLRWAHPRIRHTISTAAPTTAFSRWRLCFIHHTIRSLGELSASLLSLFLAGGFRPHLPLFNRHPFASLQVRKQPGTDHVFVWTNQSGLGPIGSSPFGVLATWIGAPLTVRICGFLTISLAAAVVHWPPHLRNASGSTKRDTLYTNYFRMTGKRVGLYIVENIVRLTAQPLGSGEELGEYELGGWSRLSPRACAVM